MSNWTHIVATLDIDTNIEDKNIKGIVEEMLEQAPQITGSERNSDIFVNVLSGHNTYIGGDCRICEYKDSVIDYENGTRSCGAVADYKCPSSNYQTRVVITIVGNLRDRLENRTKNEYNKFIKYLKKDCKFWIENETMKIVQD